jgi:phospholipase C
MFQISVVNRTHTISDLELHRVVRAINRQIAEDFAPYWGFGGRLRVEGRASGRLDSKALADMRGDAILYLLDSAADADALGYHDRNARGVPFGFVFLDLCVQLGDPWSCTLSHEALELIADPQCNLLVRGPHPLNPARPDVYHYFEVCDAVQAQVYEIDSVCVSNFVLPAYFSPNEAQGTRTDFSGTGLRSFEVNPGGYIGFFDPNRSGGPGPDTYFADNRSEERFEIKAGTQQAKREGPQGRVSRRTVPGAMVRPIVVPPARPRASQVAAQRASTADPIRHVVVLMLENRSFDHVLGGLTNSIPGLDGVNPDAPAMNIDASTGKPVLQLPVAKNVLNADMPHEYRDVMDQLRSGGANFVNCFVGHNPKSSATDRQQVMAYFEDGALPVTHALAKNYLVCNRWFSSMPGPTWPNRLFVHSGTSLGHVLMPNADNPGEIDQLWRTFRQDTIYDRLEEKGESWRIYHDGVPQSIMLDNLKGSFFSRRYASMEHFAKDAEDESSFPSYVFIEPRYASGLERENDQHPPASMTDGEELIASVYNAIRGNEELWKSTLLVLTYDEHGGFYDHVQPPAATAPDANQFPFGFESYGVRVPAILISPWVAKGCDNNQYDHTSILRYLTDKYDLRPLNERTRAAGGFGDQLLGSPREDALPPFKTLQPTRRGKQAADKLDAPIPPDNTRRVLLALGERLHAQERLARHGASVPEAAAQLPITTPTDPHAFQQRMANVDRWLAERPRPGSAQIHIPKPVVVLDHMPAADAEPIVVPPSVADGERPHE